MAGESVEVLTAGQAAPAATPATPVEQGYAEILAGVVRAEQVPVDSDFFDDLGADSLLMTQFCARVRKRGDLPPVSMKDVYQHPTIRSLAAARATPAPSQAPTAAHTPAPAPVQAPDPAPAEVQAPVGRFQYILCGTLQLVFFLGYACAAAYVAVRGYQWVSAASGLAGIYLRVVAFGGAVLLGTCTLPVVAKWALVGRWKPRRIRVWSLGYVRFWVVKTLVRSSPVVRLFAGSPLYVLYLRALGAKIGRGVAIFSQHVPVCTDLLTVGDGTVIRKDSLFSCYRAQAGQIHTGTVTIGKDAFVGEMTVLDIGTSLGDGAQLGHTSSLHTGQAVPGGEHWHGSPAQRTGVDYAAVGPARCGSLRRAVYSIVLVLNALVVLLPLAIGVTGLLLVQIPQLAQVGALMEPGPAGLTNWTFYRDALVAAFVLFSGTRLGGLLLVATVPRVLRLVIQPGKAYSLYGLHYSVHRAIARMTNVKFFKTLFGDSSYIVHYLRGIGYDLGLVEQTGSNFGTAVKHENPYLSTVGSGTMVADGLSIINAEFSSTSFRVTRTVIGPRNFLGNLIAYPSRGRTGDNCLIATKAMVPIDGDIREGVGLLGSPSFEIPRSVLRDSKFDDLEAGDGLRRRLAAKNRHNIVTIGLFLLSRWLYVFGVTLIAWSAWDLYDASGAWVAGLGNVLVLVFTVPYFVLVERAGRGFRGLRPLYCSIYDRRFWRHERYWKGASATAYLTFFNGTPFKNVIWRLLGVRLGRRVFDDGCSMPERTLVTIGDHVTLNAGSCVQCHSQEDGAFKSDRITIGAGCTVGVGAWVHYGVTMGDGAVLDADSFLMKGEEVPAGAHWRGNPARDLAAEAPAPQETAVPRVPRVPERAAALSLSRASSLLGELRTGPAAELSGLDGVGVSLYSLEAGRRHLAELAGFLSEQERELARSMGSSERRSAFVVSRALVRMLLSVRWRDDVGPVRWQLGRTDLGKLIVAGPVDAGIDLSLSYTDQFVAVASSATAEVGVDIESAGALGAHLVIWAALSNSERKRLAATPPVERPSQFLRMWTLKEAFAKCVGAGTTLGFERLATSFDPPAVLPLTAVPPAAAGNGSKPGAGARYRFHQARYRLRGEPHWLATVVRDRPRVPDVPEAGAPAEAAADREELVPA